jgi:uncharacterized zinc-type alcohol dehydrogenase-like protein
MSNIKTKGYGAEGSFFNKLKRIDFERAAPQADEVHIEVLYCGVCHSDLHQVNNDWGNTLYPCVPGHEAVGKVVAIGSAVSKFKIGDQVGVGCIIDSCNSCEPCHQHEENYCQGPHGFTATYNGYMKAEPGADFNTYGGYSDNLVVKEGYVLRIPEQLDIKAVAPILCAGVTTYAPLKRWGVKPGDAVGIVALGGLGHMAVKLAVAMGASVTVFTTDAEKSADALTFGAEKVVVSTDEEAMKAAQASINYLLITIPDEFDLTPYLSVMKLNGSIVTVGLLGEYEKPLNNMNLAMSRIAVSGSVIGGIAETQEVLDFCAEHNILPETIMINIQDINSAYDQLLKKDVHYRYIIDMQSLKDEQ